MLKWWLLINKLLLQHPFFLILNSWKLITSVSFNFSLPFVYDCQNKLAPAYFHKFFIQCAQIHSCSTRLAPRCDLLLERKNTFQYGIRSIEYNVARLWNMIPVHIRESPSPSIFWSNLKKYFLTGVIVSSNCSWIRLLLKCHNSNVINFCSRFLNNGSVTFKLWRFNKNYTLEQLDDMTTPIISVRITPHCDHEFIGNSNEGSH